jgi:uncharacterized membrane protein YhhN
MLWIALSYAILSTLIFIYVESKKNKPLFAWVLKALASFGFILVFTIGFYQRLNDSIQLNIGLFILLGLVCGMLGDLVLALRPLQPKEKDKTIIVYGIMFFSLGHIFYLITLISYKEFGSLALILGLIMLPVIIAMSKVLGFEMGKARMPTFIYTFLIFMMVGEAIYVGHLDNYTTFSTYLIFGAILFAISDLILSPIYYKGDNRAFLVISNLLTYYAAQILIALSIYYL